MVCAGALLHPHYVLGFVPCVAGRQRTLRHHLRDPEALKRADLLNRVGVIEPAVLLNYCLDGLEEIGGRETPAARRRRRDPGGRRCP